MSTSIGEGGDEPIKVINVGSRKSKLALIQTQMVIDDLKRHHPDIEFVVKTFDTTGDNILDKPLSEIGNKALFTRELEKELIAGNIDIIVHSLKDLPTTLPEHCCIGAITRREDSSDSLVFRHDLAALAKQVPSDPSQIVRFFAQHGIKTFGTSSLRRIAQLKSLSADLVTRDVRGNLNTRLAKLDDQAAHGFDALILATAGLKRGGFESRISHRLGWYHAVSQGALGIECRIEDVKLRGTILASLVDGRTALECTAERVLLKELEGGCSVPIGVRSKWTGTARLQLQAIVLSVDGTRQIEATEDEDLDAPSPSDHPLSMHHYTDVLLPAPDSNFAHRLTNCVRMAQRLAQTMIELGVKQLLNSK